MNGPSWSPLRTSRYLNPPRRRTAVMVYILVLDATASPYPPQKCEHVTIRTDHPRRERAFWVNGRRRVLVARRNRRGYDVS